MFDGIQSLARLASKTREQMNAMEQLIELLTTRNDYLTRDNHELRAQVAKLNQLLSGKWKYHKNGAAIRSDVGRTIKTTASGGTTKSLSAESGLR